MFVSNVHVRMIKHVHEITTLSFIDRVCSKRLFGYTGSWFSICVSKCMYVGQLFKNMLSVANRQHYFKVLPVLKKLGCKRLASLVVTIEDLLYLTIY